MAEKPSKKRQGLSLHPLCAEDALRAAMQVQSPEEEPVSRKKRKATKGTAKKRAKKPRK